MPGTSNLLFSGKATQERNTTYSLTKCLAKGDQFFCRKHILIKTTPNTSLSSLTLLVWGDMPTNIHLPNLSIPLTHAVLLTTLWSHLGKNNNTDYKFGLLQCLHALTTKLRASSIIKQRPFQGMLSEEIILLHTLLVLVDKMLNVFMTCQIPWQICNLMWGLACCMCTEKFVHDQVVSTCSELIT